MATPILTRFTGEIWDMSLDDLLSPMTEMPRLGGDGPFVINLCTASTPIEATSKSLPGIDNVHVYQIQRIEDRRLRYRLRIGPFKTEDAADAALIKVRDVFPGALTATAGDDDLQSIGSLQARTNALVTRPPPPPMPSEAARVATTTSTAATAGTVATAPAAPRAPTATPAPVAAAPASKATVTAAPARAPTPARTPLPPLPNQPKQAAVSAAPKSLESTQTIRPLTPLELAADDKSQWYVIQLSIADQAFDPDSLPNLDIFSVYRLYSVAALEQGRVVHALRLGFFGAEIAAQAVMSYVSAYYDKATITRVSVAERERFASQRLEARKDVGATGRHAVIEITDQRIVRERRTATPNDLRRDATVSASP